MKPSISLSTRGRLLWPCAWVLLVFYVALRVGVFSLQVDVSTPAGRVSLPNTFATVDHPFHVARAEVLWRELGEGRLLRWIGQHQGGYPVEFYPLGEAWFEVLIRAASLGALSAEGAHTLAITAIFLLPGAAFFALSRQDGFSPAAGLLAMTLHVSLPGGWYDGGYTELVQWGLVTNVAGATAAFLVLPLLVRFLASGTGWCGALAAALSAWAVYCNPRSAIGLVAIAGGAWLAAVYGSGVRRPRVAALRTITVAGAAALLSAPQLLSLARFGGLYEFVHYGRYQSAGEYLIRSAAGVTPVVMFLAIAGVAIALLTRGPASLASSGALVLYAGMTMAIAFVPAVAGLTPQLEPTRLMPLQRLLAIYLAAAAVWVLVSRVADNFAPGRKVIAPAIVGSLATAVLLVLTRPTVGAPPDPASPAIAGIGLYPVAMSAQPAQADLEQAIRAADAVAVPGSALLVIGSAISWHQQLWAPIWTTRPLFYDNWLWYWHPDHAGTPGYAFRAGHHYPDPEAALDPTYLARQGIGAVAVTGPVQEIAARSNVLQPIRTGIYDVYAVREPTTTITIDGQSTLTAEFGNGFLAGRVESAGGRAIARANWFPRWNANGDGRAGIVGRRDDGSIDVTFPDRVSAIDLQYVVQPLDWVGRGLALLGIASLTVLAMGQTRRFGGVRAWYAGR